jgi:hypothetical protein
LEINGEERGPMGRLCKVRRGSRERRDRVSEERRGEGVQGMEADRSFENEPAKG